MSYSEQSTLRVLYHCTFICMVTLWFFFRIEAKTW